MLNLADGAAPAEVLQALQYLPALAPALVPELGARRGLQLRAERIDAAPDPARLFESLFGRAANAVWLDSSLAPDGSAAAERSRFSILADDGGPFGQSVRHSSGTTRVSVGNASVRTEGPFFRWLDGVWGRPDLRAPEDYPCDFTLGWLGYLGYELKRETGGSDVTAETPDACLLFAGRAVVLDHRDGTVWLLALDTADAGGWLETARAATAAATGPSASAAAGAGGSGAVDTVRPRPGLRRAGLGSLLQIQNLPGPARNRRRQHVRGLPDHRAGSGTPRGRPGPAAAYLALRRQESRPVRELPAVRGPHRGEHLAGAFPAHHRRRRHARRADQGHPAPGRGPRTGRAAAARAGVLARRTAPRTS